MKGIVVPGTRVSGTHPRSMKAEAGRDSARKAAGAIRLALALGTPFFSALVGGCGIYTVNIALNEPFNQQLTSLDEIKFSVYNPEVYDPPAYPLPDDNHVVDGYMIWYKERSGDEYMRSIDYKGESSRPTIPRLEDMVLEWPPEKWPVYQDYRLTDPGNPRIEYTIPIDDLYHPDEGKSFKELYDADNRLRFFFAVSALGRGGEESRKIEFGQWPP